MTRLRTGTHFGVQARADRLEGSTRYYAAVLHRPFHLFQQYRDAIDIFFLTKEDNVHTDPGIAACAGVNRVASLWQVHGNRIIVAREPTQRTERADGLLTDQRGLLLTIRAADCQLILVYAPQRNVVGLLHVGWRGLIPSPFDHSPPPLAPPPCGGEGSPPSPGRQGREPGGGSQQTAIQSFFETLRDEWNIHPWETLVGIGPAIRQCCAEYREIDHLLRAFPAHFWKESHVDLAGITDAQLSALGIPPDRIERHPDCTCCHPEKYWTYRGDDREKVLEGYTNVLGVLLKQ